MAVPQEDEKKDTNDTKTVKNNIFTDKVFFSKQA